LQKQRGESCFTKNTKDYSSFAARDDILAVIKNRHLFDFSLLQDYPQENVFEINLYEKT